MPVDSNRRNHWSKFLKLWLPCLRAWNCAPVRTAGQCIYMRNLRSEASPQQPRNNPMEVSLPRSAAVNPSSARPVAAGPISGANAPSIALPLTFVMTGLLALCAGIGWLVLRPSILAAYHYNQYVIAATHLFVLGWICSVVMGAMYQLVPVALETKLYSQRLARWQFAFHVAGLSLAAAKCTYDGVSESSAVGPILHVFKSVAGFVARFDAISAMHAHAHLGGVGCFTMLIVGVSYKLIPM